MSADTDTPPKTPLVAGRYRVLADIGRGAQARTYRALDGETGEEVALKELDLKRAQDWKAIELFEREGRVLGSLDHPGIPRYLDAFSVEDDDGTTRFLLAQEFVAGESLRERIEAGHLLDEAQARALLDSLFGILDYLHSHSPPVVHRDIKPANIIVRDSADFALVDFGAVQEVVQQTVGGDTIVGTSGFLPPEQLMGRARPASDLYALGATVVYAMSGARGAGPCGDPSAGRRLRRGRRRHPAVVPRPRARRRSRPRTRCRGRVSRRRAGRPADRTRAARGARLSAHPGSSGHSPGH